MQNVEEVKDFRNLKSEGQIKIKNKLASYFDFMKHTLSWLLEILRYLDLHLESVLHKKWNS